jgi:hypothetical protein
MELGLWIADRFEGTILDVIVSSTAVTSIEQSMEVDFLSHRCMPATTRPMSPFIASESKLRLQEDRKG